MKVKHLLLIDKGRIKRSHNYLPVFTNIYYHVQKPSNFFSKLWGKIFGLVVYKVLRFKVGDYSVFIEVSDKETKKSFLDSEVKLMCTCADFKYRSAYGLNKSGNLFRNKDINEHLGVALTDAPTIDTTHICKHVYATINELNQNYTTYVKN